MAERQASLPIRIEVFDREGRKAAERFLGNLPRDHGLALDLADLDGGLPDEGGHAELVYDFRDGGEADGWLHCLVRYEHRTAGHAAESSFGAHIYNTAMTYRDEPQSYSGPPPGLSTRLFLKLGMGERHSYCCLLYPASAAWHPRSSTTLILHDSAGHPIAEAPLSIACSGSAMVWPHRIFSAALIEQARGQRLRHHPGPDLPPVRLSRPDGRGRGVLAGPHVRVLTHLSDQPPFRHRERSVAIQGSLALRCPGSSRHEGVSR